MEMGGIGSNPTLNNKRPPQESRGPRSVVMIAGLQTPLYGSCSILAPQPRSGAGKQHAEFIPAWKKEGRIKNRMSREHAHAKGLNINVSLWDSD